MSKAYRNRLWSDTDTTFNEFHEKHPEVYEKRGPGGALVAPDEFLRTAQKIQTYKTAVLE